MYYGAEEQIKLAYMSVRTEIMTQTVANASYDATSTENPDNLTALANIVRKDLNIPAGSETPNAEGYNVVADTTNASNPQIFITYTNSRIKAGTIEPGKPGENGKLEYAITLKPQNAKLKIPLKGINFGTGKTEETIKVGEDFTIGTESFRVLSKSSSQIVAVPHLNITLDTTNPVQSNTAGGTKFTNTAEDKYWTTGQDGIDWTNSKCLLKPYFEAYSKKLNSGTGNTGRISIRLGKLTEFSSIQLPDGATVTKAQIRNPRRNGSFWLGKEYPNTYYLYTVGSDGNVGANYKYCVDSRGVRPVVVINI